MSTAVHASSGMEKGMLEELLLVCTFVGTRGAPAENSSTSFVKGEDFLAWLHDMQRVLRRDESDEQSVRLTLGSWKVLETKLIPIAEASAGDEEATRTLVKIFILMTRPMSGRALEALAASGSETRLRNAALSQVRTLAEARSAFAARPRVLRVLLAFLQSALTTSEEEKNISVSERSKQAQIDLELMITLIRNLVIPLPSIGTDIDNIATQALDELVAIMDQELFLHVLAELACALNLKQNLPLNLILLEIFAALFTVHAPSDLARAEFQLSNNQAESNTTPKQPPHMTKKLICASGGTLSQALARERANRKIGSGSRHARFGALVEVKKGDQRLAISQLNSSTLRGIATEASQGLTGSNAIQKRGYAFIADSELERKNKRKAKKVDDCRGDGEDPLFGDQEEETGGELDRGPGPRRDEVWRVPQTSRLGISARRARTALSKLATQLSRHGFGTLLEAVKQEHRLESARIQARDKHCLFAFAEFCLIWRRERAHLLSSELARLAETARNDRAARNRVAARFGFGFDDSDDDDKDEIRKDTSSFVLSETGDDLSKETAFFPKSIIKLLDVYMVNSLVLQDLNRNLELKRLREVERSLSVFKEMVRALAALRDGDRNSRVDRAVALSKGATDVKPTVPGYAALISAGMLDRIFYNAEALDPLPQLLRAWRRGKHTKRYATELAELVHVSLKLLDSDKKQLDQEEEVEADDIQKEKTSSSINKSLLEEAKSRRQFDVAAYMLRLACPPAMDMYATLLESYAENDDAVNHYVYAFLYRLVRVPLSGHYSSGDLVRQPIVPSSTKITTMEPLLYQVRFLRAFAGLIADKQRRKFPSLRPLISLATDTLRHFDAHAKSNPLLYVEALFSHAGPTSTRWVERLSNQYADLSGPLFSSDKKLDEINNDNESNNEEEKEEILCGGESDEELDFDTAMKWDTDALKRAKKRKKEKSKKARWTAAEDAALSLLLADAYEDDQDRDSIDYVRLSKLAVLLPHHQERKALKRRLGILEKAASDLEGATGHISDKLRSLAEVKKKNAKKNYRSSSSAKKRRKGTMDDLFIADDDEDEEVKSKDSDDEDQEDDDDEDENPQQQPVERPILSNNDEDDDDDEDDRWKQPSFFKKRAALAAVEEATSQEKPSQRRRLQRATSDTESDSDNSFDDMPVSQDASAHRRQFIQEDEDSD